VFTENLKDMKKYVNEVEKMISNKKVNNESLKDKKNAITERIKTTSLEKNTNQYNNNKCEYNNYLLDSLRNMIVNINTKLKDNI
jgi:uncharacterized protein YktA (UPF0223 family)